MLTLEINIKIPPHVIFTAVDGTAVLLNTQTNQYFSLDNVGARFWELLKGGYVLREIYRMLLTEYEVAPATLGQDILELVTSLEKNGLVAVNKK